jgi:hypothetical protein
MTTEQTAEIVAKIDWKEMTKKLLFEGMVPAAKYAVTFTPNKIDDTTVEVIDKLGQFLLGEEAPKAE